MRPINSKPFTNVRWALHQTRNPFVSVIMPVCNEADFIEKSLTAVLMQNYPADRLEILVADGMSSDATRDLIAQTAAEQSTVPVMVLDNPGRIASMGLNTALKVAKGAVIIRVDGHTVIAPNYVRQCVATLKSRDAQNVGGPMRAVGTSRFARAVALATSSRFGVGGARFHYADREEWVDTVYLGAWPSELYARIGAFDEEMVRNQDDEFNYRLRAHGGRILLSPKIKSRYFNRTTMRSLLSQYFRYGYWKVRVFQKHPRQMKPRQFAPLALVVVLLASGLAAPFSALGRMVGTWVLLLYIVVNLSASLWVCLSKHEWRLIPLVATAFAALHFSYGLGFLIGLIRFWNRWRDRRIRFDSGNLAVTDK
jgi:succinoglycan biosynthesis protein ExoA